jgi:hypothetical protein
MSGSYERVLDHARGTVLLVAFTTVGPDVVDYALALLVEAGGELQTVRVYESAHRFNEMHRYTRSGGKQVAVAFHPGTLGEGMRAAIAEIARSHSQMIEGWDR